MLNSVKNSISNIKLSVKQAMGYWKTDPSVPAPGQPELLSKLPSDVLIYGIAPFLHGKDRSMLPQVNKKFEELFKDVSWLVNDYRRGVKLPIHQLQTVSDYLIGSDLVKSFKELENVSRSSGKEILISISLSSLDVIFAEAETFGLQYPLIHGNAGLWKRHLEFLGWLKKCALKDCPNKLLVEQAFAAHIHTMKNDMGYSE